MEQIAVPIRVGIIGIGGFAREHVQIIAELARQRRIQCSAYCDPNAAAYPEQARMLEELGAKHYEDYRVMLGAHPGLNMAVIVTPIPLHKPMIIHAMERGIHVLTEKPPCVAIEDLDEMIEAANHSGKLAAVNFQNTSGQAFKLMLQKLQEGVIGDVRTVVGVGRYRRVHEYFKRTPWAGKLTLKGSYVLDGPIFNALSHVLNNCLIVAGSGDSGRAEPRTVQAELYRCNPIESEDTSCVRIRTANGIDVYHYATLSSSEVLWPTITVTGSQGEMVWSIENELTIRTADGASESFQFPPEQMIRNMYENMIDVLTGKQERLYCSIQDCRSFTLAANGAFTSSGMVQPIPRDALTDAVEGNTGRPYTYIPLIGEHMEQAAGQHKLFSETGIPWAVSSLEVDMLNYKRLQVQAGIEQM